MAVLSLWRSLLEFTGSVYTHSFYSLLILLRTYYAFFKVLFLSESSVHAKWTGDFCSVGSYCCAKKMMDALTSALYLLTELASLWVSDSNSDDFDPASTKSKYDSMDFDSLLKEAQRSLRR